MFKKILVANRGEIACRVMRTCKALGVKTVAVFSTADANALHVALADEAVCIGEPESTKSYLDIKKICAAARKSKAEAVHPGYGFLSENGVFADALVAANICFIGPSAKVMGALGDKVAAKKIAQKAKVPMVPSVIFKSGTPAGMEKEAKAFAAKCGFPVMIKAAAGGGGRGMRRVDSPEELPDKLAAAARESLAAFGSDRLFMEKLVEHARHIEVQIVADRHGNVFAISDRDCSLQRNHQKVIEEAPAPGIKDATRKKIHAAACALCKSAGYENAGTVEFLLDRDENFYFLEVNSRLQVEHPVTEEISGFDLVELQLRAACGENLKPVIGSAIGKTVGAAIECRLCAEDPGANFVASTGKLECFAMPKGIRGQGRVRVDSGFQSGDEISHYYDSLLAKLIVTAPTRAQAIQLALDSLAETRIYGVRSNVGFLRALLEAPEFQSVTHHTNFAKTVLPGAECFGAELALVAALPTIQALAAVTTSSDPWDHPSSFRVAGHTQAEFHANVNGHNVSGLIVRKQHSVFEITSAGLTQEVIVDATTGETIEYQLKGERDCARIFSGAKGLWVNCAPGTFEVRPVTPTLKTSGKRAKALSGLIASPLPGKIVLVKTKEGSVLQEGDPLMVIESMKMEHIIRAPHAAQVKRIHVKGGEVIEANALLAELHFDE